MPHPGIFPLHPNKSNDSANEMTMILIMQRASGLSKVATRFPFNRSCALESTDWEDVLQDDYRALLRIKSRARFGGDTRQEEPRRFERRVAWKLFANGPGVTSASTAGFGRLFRRGVGLTEEINSHGEQKANLRVTVMAQFAKNCP
jgi:hypothetical protein